MVLRGPDEVLVPNVVTSEQTTSDLTSAVQKLQEKGLNAWIQMKASSTYPRGIVMEQRPRPGAVVKAGRTIMLTVSSGSVVESVGNYVGKFLSSLKLELQELFSSGVEPLIQIREPVMYVYNDLPAETILEQSPEPGTEVRENEVTYLDLVVSKGPRGEVFELPDYQGRPFRDVIQAVAAEGIVFVVEARPAEEGERSGVVVEQEPEPGEELDEGETISLTMTEPRVSAEEEEFGIFSVELPRYPIVVRIELFEQLEDESRLILAMQHPGGPITIPYVKSLDSRLVFMVNGDVWGR